MNGEDVVNITERLFLSQPYSVLLDAVLICQNDKKNADVFLDHIEFREKLEVYNVHRSTLIKDITNILYKNNETKF